MGTGLAGTGVFMLLEKNVLEDFESRLNAVFDTKLLRD